MAAPTSQPRWRWWHFWPCIVLGIPGAMLSRWLRHRIPFPLAMGLSFFAVFFLSMALVYAHSGLSRRRATAAFLGAATGALVVGVMAHFFPY